MRVLTVINSLVPSGGAEQAVAVTAGPLVARGVELHVLPLKPQPGLHERVERSGATVHRLDVAPQRREWVRATADVIRQVRPDLVHTTVFEADLAGRLAAFRTRTAVVSSLVNVAYGRSQSAGLSYPRVLAAQAADAATARLVRRFHSLSDYVADVMARRLLISRGKIDVIPRGRDAATFGERSPERRRSVRATLGLPDDAPVFLIAARHEPQKGVDLALRAWPGVLAARPQARLLLAGREGRHSEELQGLVRAAGATGSVVFLGIRSDVPDLMAAADGLVVPSRWEGLGSTAIEGMGAGIPLIVSDIPPLREAVGGPEAAALVSVQDSAALAGAMLSVLNDPAAAQRRAGSAQVRFQERFELDRVVDAMIDFYERALS